MKLHIPLGLRRALYSVFAYLQSVAVASALVAATASAADLTLKKNNANYSADAVNVGNIDIKASGLTDLLTYLGRDYSVTATTGDVTSTGTVATPTGFSGSLTLTSAQGNVNLNNVSGKNMQITPT